MPLVRISLPHGKTDSYRTALSKSDIRSDARDTCHPRRGRFQVITGHGQGQLIADPHFMNMDRSAAGFVLIQIFLSRGRTTAIKQSLYRRITERLAASPGIRPDDVMIVLTETGLDDWSG